MTAGSLGTAAIRIEERYGTDLDEVEPVPHRPADLSRVVGEQLPEATTSRSTGPAGRGGSGSGSIPAARQWATRAYSSPDEPAANRGRS